MAKSDVKGTMTHHPLASLAALCLTIATVIVVAWLPEHLAPAEDVADRLPTYVGVVGYRFEAHAATASRSQELIVDLGPTERAPTGPSARSSARPYLALPWLDGTDPTMTLTSRCVTAAGAAQPTCTLRFTPKVATQLPTAAVWRLSKRSTTQVTGDATAASVTTTQTWPSHLLQAGDEVTLTPRKPRRPGDQRRLKVTDDDGQWRMGGCALPRQADRAGAEHVDRRVALLDLFHTASTSAAAATSAGAAATCVRTEVTDSDRLQQRWLAPTGKGGYALPMRSFVQMIGPADGERPQLVLLRDDGFPQLHVNGKPAVAAPLQISLRPGEQATLNVARRRFQTRRMNDAQIVECNQTWQPECARLKVYLARHALQLKVRKDGSVELLLDQNSAALRSYSHVALQPEELRSRGRPVRLIYAHGTGAAARLASSNDQPGVRELQLPFTVLDGLSYTATLRLKREEGGVTIRYRDASRSSRWEQPGRFEGGSRYHPLFEVDIARQPHPLVRGLAAPYAVLSVAFLLCLLAFGRHAGVWRLVVFGNAMLLLLAAAAVVHGLLGYAVFTQHPWDWEAFDQLVLGGVALPSAIVVGASVGLAMHLWPASWWRPLRADRDHAAPSPRRLLACSGAALALVLLAQGVRFGMAGRESLGPIRVAALLPVLIGLHALWFALAQRAVPELMAHPARSTGGKVGKSVAALLVSPVGSGLLLGLGVAAWWADKGAMLLFVVPTATMAALSHLQLWRAAARAAQRHGDEGTTETRGARGQRWLHGLAAVVIVIGVAGCLHFTRAAMTTLFRMDLPEVQVTANQFCASGAAEDAAMALACVDTITARSQRSALATMDAGGLFATDFNRRHKIRFLDWINDGSPAARCQAAARLPTQAGVEVAFFRAISRAYLTTPRGDRAYLQPGLVAFDSGTRNSLLDDYLAIVQAATQFPPTLLSLLSLLAALVVVLGLLLSAPQRKIEGSLLLVVGVSTLLLAALTMTIAANYDVWPNFAQSTPLIAIRSHSAWLLDALILGLLAAGFVVRNLGRDLDRDEVER